MIRFSPPEDVTFTAFDGAVNVTFGGLSSRDLSVLGLIGIDLPKRKGRKEDGEEPSIEYYTLEGASYSQIANWVSRHDTLIANKLKSINGIKLESGEDVNLDAMGSLERQQFIEYLDEIEGFVDFKLQYISGPKKKSSAVD